MSRVSEPEVPIIIRAREQDRHDGSRERTGGTGWALASLGTALVLLILMGVSRFEEVWQWPATVAGLVLVIGYVVVYVRSAHLVITDRHVEKRRWGWPATRLRRALVDGLNAPLQQPLEPRVFPIVFLRERGPDGRARGRRIKLSGWYWSADALDRTCAELDIRTVKAPIRAGEYERLAPGALTFRYRRPVLWAVTVVAGGLFVTAVGIAMVLVLFFDY